MAEGSGLLNRRTGLTGTGGSNPPLSAISFIPETLMKTFTKIALVLAAVIAIPFLGELIISSYDIATNPWTLPNSVVAEGGFAREGANRREFREPRFRARGLQFYFWSVVV